MEFLSTRVGEGASSFVYSEVSSKMWGFRKYCLIV